MKLWAGDKLKGGWCLWVLAALCIAGCWGDNDFDHTPPAGQGSIVVDNRTGRDLDVFIAGEAVPRVRSRRWRAFDRAPGIYRVVLDERRGDRNFRDDVDVLSGRLTVLEVTTDPGYRTRFSVFTYFD